MKIVIAGAGDIGFHLAKHLSNEQKDIILIDLNQEVLDYANTHLDVLTLNGDSSSVEVLRKAKVQSADIFLAVTTYENNNIVSAILAKKLGVKRTIARVNNPEYLRNQQKATFKEIGIDKLISPVLLAAYEIDRLLDLAQVTDVFEFENGRLLLIGTTLDESCPFLDQTLNDISRQPENMNFIFRPMCILRDHETILPRGSTILKNGDHVYFITKRNEVNPLLAGLGKPKKQIKKVMIIGGNSLVYTTAKILEKRYNITIVEKEKSNCKYLIERLNKTLVVKGDPGNIELMKEEGLDQMDAFIALTRNSEINIISSLMAEDAGVTKTIALVDNTDYTHISQNIGVDTLINKKLIAANNIFRFVRKGKVEAIASLHGVDAEIIEYILDHESKLTRVPIKDLNFPKDALIGGIIRGKTSFIPSGDLQMEVQDKVIVIARPDSIPQIEALFK